jgi:hypothetical protein
MFMGSLLWAILIAIGVKAVIFTIKFHLSGTPGVLVIPATRNVRFCVSHSLLGWISGTTDTRYEKVPLSGVLVSY